MSTSSPNCHFCGHSGKSTKEHVWPKWLHETDTAKQLMAGYKGERERNLRTKLVLGDRGIYGLEPEDMGHWSPLLPQVKVPVCQSCNNGWMSVLETQANELLGPLIFKAETVHLSLKDQQILSAWAAKTFMAYALTRGSQGNPFSRKDYEYLCTTRTPPPGLRLWVFTSDSRWAQVGIDLQTWVFGERSEGPEFGSDNSVLGVLAAAGVVFLAVKMPARAASMTDFLTPPRWGCRPHELTAAQMSLQLAPAEFGENHMDQVHQWRLSAHHFLLPSPVGLTESDFQRVRQVFFAGVAPHELNRALSSGARDRTPCAVRHHVEAERLAELFLQSGDPEGAAIHLTRAGREHFYENDFLGAAELMEKAANLPGGDKEDDPHAAYRVGQALWNLQDPKAATWYRRAIELGLDDNAPHFGLIDSLMHAGSYAEALQRLQAVCPRSAHEEATVLMASTAVSYVVDELGIGTQQRTSTQQDDILGTAPEEAWDHLLTRDALSRPAWISLGWARRSALYHFARAWFGDAGDSWMMAALAISHSDMNWLLEVVLRLGLSRSADLALRAEQILDAMESTGAPVEVMRRSLILARS